MTVTVITDDLVKVEPDKLDENDILEFAEALIEEHGHIHRDSGDTTRGFSIHGAIGEAAKRATGANDKGDSSARPLRDAAKKKVEDAHPGETETGLNDKLDKAGAIEALRAARGAQ